MDFDLKKLAPWNWFKKEEEESPLGPTIPFSRSDLSSGKNTVPAPPVQNIHQQIDRWFDDALRGFGWPSTATSHPGFEAMLKPALDVQESENEYKISLEVPGVEEKDINLQLSDDVLTIHGEKKQEKKETQGGFHRVERSYGSFRRTLNLPENADKESIKATFNHGVLNIIMKKCEVEENPTTRTIPVESSS